MRAADWTEEGDERRNFKQWVMPVLDLFINKQQENYVYDEYNNPETQADQTKVVLGNIGSDKNGGTWKDVGTIASRPIHFLNPETGVWESVASVNHIGEAMEAAGGGNQVFSGKVVGKVKAINGGDVPTGQIAVMTDDKGIPYHLVIGDLSEEQSKEMRIVTDLAKAQYSLQVVERDHVIWEADKLGELKPVTYTVRGRPVVTMIPGDDAYSETYTGKSVTSVDVEIYDSKGVFQGVTPLENFQKMIEDRSDYTKQEKLSSNFIYNNVADGKNGQKRGRITARPVSLEQRYTYHDPEAGEKASRNYRDQVDYINMERKIKPITHTTDGRPLNETIKDGRMVTPEGKGIVRNTSPFSNTSSSQQPDSQRTRVNINQIDNYSVDNARNINDSLTENQQKAIQLPGPGSDVQDFNKRQMERANRMDSIDTVIRQEIKDKEIKDEQNVKNRTGVVGNHYTSNSYNINVGYSFKSSISGDYVAVKGGRNGKDYSVRIFRKTGIITKTFDSSYMLTQYLKDK